MTTLSDQKIFHNPNAYPRAFLAPEPLPATADEARHAFGDPRRDLQRHAVIEGDFPRSDRPAEGSVRIVEDRPELVVLECSTPTGGIVILHDSMSGGWEATVDGEPRPALTANYLFRGVHVPPGQHVIQWSYTAPGFRTGIAVSLVTVLSLVGLLAVGGGMATTAPVTQACHKNEWGDV
jgi:hypothetical protein